MHGPPGAPAPTVRLRPDAAPRATARSASSRVVAPSSTSTRSALSSRTLAPKPSPLSRRRPARRGTTPGGRRGEPRRPPAAGPAARARAARPRGTPGAGAAGASPPILPRPLLLRSPKPRRSPTPILALPAPPSAPPSPPPSGDMDALDDVDGPRPSSPPASSALTEPTTF